MVRVVARFVMTPVDQPALISACLRDLHVAAGQEHAEHMRQLKFRVQRIRSFCRLVFNGICLFDPVKGHALRKCPIVRVLGEIVWILLSLSPLVRR